jgi:arylsulfatase A-like enzyme
MIDKHYVMYEDVTHVPLIVRLPGAALSGQACDAWVSHFIDLPPTLLELAGLSIPPTFAGRSLAGLLRGTRDQAPGNEAVFSAYHGNQMGLFSQRMVRTRDWKYVWNACAEDECYCLRDDPGELRNRATDPTCAEVCKDLRIRLAQWMESERDPLLNGWTRDQLMNGLTR